ncbi:hypothetical protein SLS61_005206 [Didymella pomorum]
MSYDFRLPLKTELTPQEDELYDSDALPTDVLNGDMSSSRESSSTSDSLYAIPPPRIMRTIARNRQNSEHFSIRDVPPLSLDGTSDSAAHHRTCPLRVVNEDLTPFITSSSTVTDWTSRIRLKEKSARVTINFTNPFAEQKQERPMASLQAAVNEKRKVNAELDDMTQQLQNAFKEFHKAEKLGTQLCSQSPIAKGQPTPTEYHSIFAAPPPGKILAGSLRLPDCYTCIRHLHEIMDEKRHEEHLERRAEEELLQKRKQEQEHLRAQKEYRRQTRSMRYWTSTPVIARTPTTTWIEDAQDVRDLRSNPSIQASPKVDSKPKPEAAPATSTSAAPKDKPKSFTSPPVDLVKTSPPRVPSSDARAKSPASYSRADCVQALGKADTAAKAASAAAKTKAEQTKGRLRLCDAAKKILAAQEQAEEDAQWDNVDLSDDEGWDKVAEDEAAEKWEVLEK